MKKKEIVKLLRSDTPPDQIAETLINAFKEKPELLDLKFGYNRHIFHRCVLKDKPDVLLAIFKFAHDTTHTESVASEEKTLAEKIFNVAIQKDEFGKTILHLAAMKKKGSEQNMEVILQYLRKILNMQDDKGNTPFHMAVIRQQEWAVRFLASQKDIDRHIQNLGGQTALDLVEDNKVLRKAMTAIDLSGIKTLDLETKPYNPDSAKSILSEYHSLSSPDSAAETSKSSSSTGFESDSFEGFTPQSGQSETGLDGLEIDNADNINPEAVLRMLLAHVKAGTRGRVYTQLMRMFIHSCAIHSMNAMSDDLRKEIESTNTGADLLKTLLSHLHGANIAHEERFGEQIQNFTLEFERHLLELSFKAGNSALPVTDPVHENKIEEFIWKLTSWEAMDPKSYVEMRTPFIHKIIGLLGYTSENSILRIMSKFYPDFTRNQKINACLAVWYIVTKGGISYAGLDVQFQSFISQINKIKLDSGDSREKTGEYLKQLEECYKKHHSAPIKVNYDLLKRWNEQLQTSNKETNSFDKLVDKALSKKPNARNAELLQISQEMRAVTSLFYQELSISEFHKWHLGKKPNQLSSMSDYFNRMNAYFTDKLLKQPNDNMVNTMAFLVQLARALCPLHGGQYPDLHSVQCILSVLDKNSITRLKKYLKQLDKQEKRDLEELSKVISSKDNFSAMRQIFAADPTTLPYLGLFQADFTFGVDGNTFENSPECIFSNVFQKILYVQAAVKKHLVLFNTNLRDFIQQYQMPDDNELYRRSLSILARSHDVWRLNRKLDFNKFLDHLEKSDYFTEGVLPVFSGKGNSETNTQSIGFVQLKLLEIFAWQVKKAGTRETLSTDLFHRLCKAMINLENVCNEHYQTERGKVNPVHRIKQVYEYSKRIQPVLSDVCEINAQTDLSAFLDALVPYLEMEMVPFFTADINTLKEQDKPLRLEQVIERIIALYPNRGSGASENALFMRMKKTVLYLAGLSQIVDESPVCTSKIKQDIDQALNQTSNRRLSIIPLGDIHPNSKKRVSKSSVFNKAGSVPKIDHSKDSNQFPEERGLSKTY